MFTNKSVLNRWAKKFSRSNNDPNDSSPTKTLPKRLYNEFNSLPDYFSEKLVSFKTNMGIKDKNSANAINTLNNHPQQEEQKVEDHETNKKPPEPDSILYQSCDICQVELLSGLIFKNEYCRHKFCLYCLEEANPKTAICVLKTCPNGMNLDEVKEFCSRKGNGENSRQDVKSSQNHIKNFKSPIDPSFTESHQQPAGKGQNKCDICTLEILPNLIFTNDHCGHRYCLYCIQEGISDSGLCMLKRCPLELDKDKIKHFSSQNGYGEAQKENLKSSQTQIQDYVSTAGSGFSASKPNVNVLVILNSIADENQKLVQANNHIQQQIALEEHKHQEQKRMLYEDFGSEMECSICLDYIYRCVTAMPCLHNFCAACLSDYMQKSKLCPLCTEEFWAVKKNANMNNIIENFLKQNPSKRRPQKEYEDMDRRDQIKQETVKMKN